jgi:5-methylcytosine-specific restriction endonuclease McrA
MWFRKRPDEPPNFAPRAYLTLKKKVHAVLASLGPNDPLPEGLFTSSVWSSHKGLFEIVKGKGKCAFCERYRDLEGECQLDHFRPRSAVSSFATPPNCTDSRRPKITSQGRGYWWLAYSWTNLVLVCPGCNGAKSSLFPVRTRCSMSEGASTSAEQPYLLDPHDTSLAKEPHFRWSISGTIEPISRGSRAEWTIVICELDREGLRDDRVKKTNELLRAFDKYFEAIKDFEDNANRSGGTPDAMREQNLNRCEEDLRSLGSATAEHSGLVRWFIARWCEERGLAPFEW